MKQYGPEAFKLRCLRPSSKEGETQSEFAEEIDALLEMYEEK
jgi:hypothetical protein